MAINKDEMYKQQRITNWFSPQGGTVRAN